jgi:hypothetical protein
MPSFIILVFGDVSLVFEPVNQRNKNTVKPPYVALSTFLTERYWTTEEVCIYIRAVKQYVGVHFVGVAL